MPAETFVPWGTQCCDESGMNRHAVSGPLLGGKRVLITQCEEFMGPVLCEVFAAHGATVVGSTEALDGREAPGRIVEEASTQELFASPSHPYTRGLLTARPRLGEPDVELATIPGVPPDPRRLPAGCSFWPRCAARCIASGWRSRT